MIMIMSIVDIVVIGSGLTLSNNHPILCNIPSHDVLSMPACIRELSLQTFVELMAVTEPIPFRYLGNPEALYWWHGHCIISFFSMSTLEPHKYEAFSVQEGHAPSGVVPNVSLMVPDPIEQ
ncbi:hypothetical protein Tco_0115094 [Tanacetum coccineum]|uniref:Uncharacterized protein n=1 Tax=Tanacetum coccineum TaxID=301880 RepID=A0ABQ5AE03_9ASTR